MKFKSTGKSVSTSMKREVILWKGRRGTLNYATFNKWSCTTMKKSKTKLFKTWTQLFFASIKTLGIHLPKSYVLQ